MALDRFWPESERDGLKVGFGLSFVGAPGECTCDRAESRGSPLDGNWFECSKSNECFHEALGPWPTSWGTKRDLSRSVDEASRQSDEVAPKATSDDHGFILTFLISLDQRFV